MTVVNTQDKSRWVVTGTTDEGRIKLRRLSDAPNNGPSLIDVDPVVFNMTFVEEKP